MLLAAVGAEMTVRIQRTLLGPFQIVLHADQIEYNATHCFYNLVIMGRSCLRGMAVSGSASQDMHSSL